MATAISSAENRMPAPEVTIRQAQAEVKAYLEAKGTAWTGMNKHYYLVTHLAEEVGELARAVINIESREVDPSRRGLDAPDTAKSAALRDGLGDIFFHLIKISVAYGLDLQDAFQAAFASIRNRYPTNTGVSPGRFRMPGDRTR